MKKFRFLGLRWARFRQWRQVLADEGHRTTPKDWAAMVSLLVRLAASKPRSAEDRKRIRRNLAVCIRCQFHDRHFRRCAGCGCFVIYKIAAGGQCWAREQDPSTEIGF